MREPKRGAIFRVDDIFVDMTKYHYFAWRRLAEELGVSFTIADNDRMRGIGSLKSLEILLEGGGLDISREDKYELCARKLNWLIEHVQQIDPADLQTGSRELLRSLRALHVPCAALVARPESALVLARLGIVGAFDALVDPSYGILTDPAPSDYRTAAEALDLAPGDCLAFEPDDSGISAAHEAGLSVVGVGSRELLSAADQVVSGLWSFQPNEWFRPSREAIV